MCDDIVSRLSVPWVVILSQDRFYRPLTKEERINIAKYNFDHPNAFDFHAFYECLVELSNGRSVALPRYDFRIHSRMDETDVCYGSDVIIVEGILSLYDPQIRRLMDLKIYVDTDDDIRLARRIKRDIAERGRTVDDVLQQYVSTVKPAFDEFISPTKRYADLILPRGTLGTFEFVRTFIGIILLSPLTFKIAPNYCHLFQLILSIRRRGQFCCHRTIVRTHQAPSRGTFSNWGTNTKSERSDNFSSPFREGVEFFRFVSCGTR